MRKQTKFVAVLSAAALFAIGASMTSFAATAHWEQEGEDWVYLDRDGNRETDTWKKSGNNWFYLDSDGYMARDQIIISGSNDDKYYVDANGARVANTWVSVDNEGDNECTDQEDVSTIWYFFGSNGKARKGEDDAKVFTNIPYGTNGENRGTFAFDEEGHMLSGWQDITLSTGTVARYYFNDENEGWAATGWQYLVKPETSDYGDEPYEDEAWFWFGTNGRAHRNKTSYINGEYYTFDEEGAMDDRWVQGTPGITNSTAVVASDAHAFYTDDIGHRRTGWIYTYDPEDVDEEGDQHWFYLSTRGEAFNDQGKDTDGLDSTATDEFDGTGYEGVAARVIRNQTFLFNNEGRMITGVVRLSDAANRVGGTDLVANGIYYFSEEDGSGEGAMQTGRVTYDNEGEQVTYYFRNNGQAYTNAYVRGSIYDENGQRVEAEDGSRYMLYTTEADIYEDGNMGTEENPIQPLIKAGTTIVVNSSGSVRRSGTVEIDGIRNRMGNESTGYEATFEEIVE